MIFIPIHFAFLLLAYFEGKRLSRFQVKSIVGIYSAFKIMMLGFILDGFTKVLLVEELISETQDVFIG